MRYAFSSALITTVFVAVYSGCRSSRIAVPPRIDLSQHEILGIIEFKSSSQGELGPTATQEFLEAIRRDQGVVRIIELGTETAVLAEIGRSRLDREAYRAMGERYGISTVLAGDLTVTNVKPSVRVSPGAGYMGVAADVDASLATRMIEVATGASLWNASANATRRVGDVHLGAGGATFDADDPERAYGDLVSALVTVVARDFQVTWARR